MPRPIRTTLVGSYAQPEWLIDREALRTRLPQRILGHEPWRVPADFLQEAMDDAVLGALRDQEEAGIDIVTDGEIRRASYSAPLANAPEGVDRLRHGTLLGRAGKPNQVPLVSGPLRLTQPVHAADVRFLRAHTTRTLKATIPGPFTLSQLAVSTHYASGAELALAYADCVNTEIRALFAAGADVVQLDEPYLQARQSEAEDFGLAAIARALEGIEGETALHVCFGYAAMVGPKQQSGYSCLPLVAQLPVRQVSIEAAQPASLDLAAALAALGDKTIMVGVLNLGDDRPETPAIVAERLRRALRHLPPERLIAAPDCGMKYLPRAAAKAKLEALCAGTAIVNRELGLA